MVVVAEPPLGVDAATPDGILPITSRDVVVVEPVFVRLLVAGMIGSVPNAEPHK